MALAAATAVFTVVGLLEEALVAKKVEGHH